jgi:hypothetical protein
LLLRISENDFGANQFGERKARTEMTVFSAWKTEANPFSAGFTRLAFLGLALK